MRTQLHYTRRTPHDSDEAELAIGSFSRAGRLLRRLRGVVCLMLRGFVPVVSWLWRLKCLGNDFDVFCCRWCSLVVDVIPGARVVPDLVFLGSDQHL
jgi:type III pantothenate kinase